MNKIYLFARRENKIPKPEQAKHEKAQLKYKAKPIHIAIMTKDFNDVLNLVRSGVDLNVEDTEGRTPLDYLARALGTDKPEDFEKLLLLLVKKGAKEYNDPFTAAVLTRYRNNNRQFLVRNN